MSHYDRDPSTGNLIQTAGMRSLDEVKAIMLDICYPVGSIYQSTENVSPATFLGGTWISLSGYMLRGATSGVRQNTNALDGGADSVTISSVASHNHTQNAHGHGLVNNGNPDQTLAIGPHTSNGGNYRPSGTDWGATNSNAGWKHISNTTATNIANGSNYTVNTLPKYKNVYMWERTA